MYRFKKKVILFIINHFLCGTHAFAIKRRLLNHAGNINIGINSKIVGPIYIYGSLCVGDDTWVGHDFRVEGNGNVIIGNRCDVAPLVTCFTGGHLIGDHERRAGEGITKEIEIGDGCWVGGQSVLLQGVKICDGVVIAAGSVVTKNIDEDFLVGGVPAKIIRNM